MFSDATTTNKDWGYIPVPGKGGKTTNYDNTMTDSERREICWGRKEGAVNA